jgi:hypothetical protein
MLKPAIVLLAVTCGALLPAMMGTTASGAASTRITEPADTYHVVLDASGNAGPVTVVATGFAPGTQVFAEECDGRSPSDPNWAPTSDCDPGNAPAPSIADPSGTVRFSNTDRNRLFVPFVGTSASGLFNCVAPHETPTNKQLPSYTKCQIRVSSNNTAATEDQVFRSIVIGTGSGGGSSSGSGTTLAVVVVALVVVGGIVAAVLLLRRRRRPAVRHR